MEEALSLAYTKSPLWAPLSTGLALLAWSDIPLSPSRFAGVVGLIGAGAARLASAMAFLIPLGLGVGVLALPAWLVRWLLASAFALGPVLWACLTVLLASGEFADSMAGPCQAGYLSIDLAFMLTNVSLTFSPVRLWTATIPFVLAVQVYVTLCASCVESGSMSTSAVRDSGLLTVTFAIVYLCGIPLLAAQQQVFVASVAALRQFVPFPAAVAVQFLAMAVVVFASINSIAIGWTLVLAQRAVLGM